MAEPVLGGGASLTVGVQIRFTKATAGRITPLRGRVADVRLTYYAKS